MGENPLKKLESFGQSIWVDYIRRKSIDSGELSRWINEDGVSGVTSNPSIFHKAITGSDDYDETIHTQAIAGHDSAEIFRVLATEDIQRAADLFRPVYDRTGGADGFVSIEVSPGLAHDTKGTLEEARQIWKRVNRPNIMVKVPGTRAGLPAIRQLISEGMNINITLLFGLPRYREVVEAYLSGLEALQASGGSLKRVASVASFFLSRIDVLIDPQLEKIIEAGGERAELARPALGQTAIASAKLAYLIYLDIFQGQRFQKLADHGARPQRLLWASTSTKNPNYPDVMYVEALIGPDTVNTLPVETLDAYRDHGQPAPRLSENIALAHQVMKNLQALGINIDDATQQLEDEGVEKFSKAFDELMTSLSESRAAALQASGRPAR